MNDWNKVKGDPKLDKLIEALDNELFNKEINPTGQLIIFTESNDTENYLAEKLENEKATKEEIKKHLIIFTE